MKKCAIFLALLVACDSSTGPSTLDPAARLVNVVVFDSDRSGHYAVYKMNFDGSSVQLLTPASDTASCPSVSPDGSSVVYYAVRGQDSTVAVLMRADGANRVELMRGWRFDGCPVWSPKGDRIILQPAINPSKPSNNISTFGAGGGLLTAFASGSAVVASTRGSDALVYDLVSLTGNQRIVISRFDGSDMRILSANAMSPAVSSVADQVVEDCWQSGAPTSHALCSVRSDGTLMWRFSTSIVGAPTFSPNGKLIAFNCVGTICITTAEGTGTVSAAAAAAAAVVPVAWSPASDKIFFPCFPRASFENNYSEDICRINSDGTALMNLTSGYHNQHVSIAQAAQ